MIGIYKITSPTNRVYIGQSVNIKSRWSRYKNLECISQPALYNSLKKYTPEKHKFEVLLECSKCELDEKERYYQDLFDVINNGLNCILTSSINSRGKMSDDTKLKISIAHKGKILSEITKEKIRLANLGKRRNNPPTQKMLERESRKKAIKPKRVLSEEQKEKIRKSLTGKKRDVSIGIKTGNALRGRKLSEETKLKISKNNSRWNLGKKHSEETRLKISENSKTKRSIINCITGVIYNSIKEASEKENLNYGKLRKYMHSKNNNKFKYL
jgi:group I intron endonuclease